MQPFGIPKIPKVTVPTRKQPPVHRYPAPGGVAQPGVLNSGEPTQLRSHNPPFAEDISKASFEVTQHHQQNIGSEYKEDNFFETPEELAQNDFQTHNRGPSLEETPAGVFKGQNIDKLLQENIIAGKNRNLPNMLDKSEAQLISDNIHSQHIISNAPPNTQLKFDSPVKRAIGTKDDDEYVRMASADEEEEEGLEVEHKAKNIQEEKPDAFRRYKEDIVKSISGNKIGPNISMNEDTNLLLKLKRIDLELTKEKKKTDFLENEQEKLIHENAELRKRIEELNARADLMKKYDYSERFARKEEETERLKLEVLRLKDENRILNTHAQRILQENNEYKKESEILIVSLQEEKRRMQEELQFLKRETDARTNSKLERITERNQILENQLAELRHQISVLTDQLTKKTEAQQRISNVSEGIQSLVSSLSKVTDHTQTHPAALLTQESQTSPTRLSNQFIPKHTIDTQTQRVVHESHFSQTSPIKVQSEFRPQASIEVQTSIHPSIQTATQTHAAVLHSQVSQTSPALVNQRAFITSDQLHSSPKLQKEENYQLTSKEEDQIIINQEEVEQNQGFHNTLTDSNELAVAVDNINQGSTHVSNLEEAPPMNTNAITDQINQIKHEQKPKTIHPPPFNPSHHHQGPPKFKIPTSQIPKRPEIGFKPVVPHHNPFSQEEEVTYPDNSEKQDKISSPHVDNDNQGLPLNINESQHSHLEAFNVNAEEIPPLPSQTESASAFLHNRGPIHPEVKEEQVSSDLRNTESGLPENIEEPPKILPPQMKTVGQGAFGTLTNRPPLYNVHHNKTKVHKIGKNPFSNEPHNDVSSLFGASVVSESFPEQSNMADLSQSHDVITTNQQSLEYRDNSANLQPAYHKEDDKISAEAAEGFFDQLGSNQNQQYQGHTDIAPPSRYEVKAPQQSVNWGSNENIKQSFMQEETHDLTKSFQSDINSQNARVKEAQNLTASLTGKTIPVKKKKGVLPSNMFD